MTGEEKLVDLMANLERSVQEAKEARDVHLAAKRIHASMSPAKAWGELSADCVRNLCAVAKAALDAPDLDAAARAAYEADELCRDLNADRGHDTWERCPSFLQAYYRSMAVAARQTGEQP